MYVKSVERSLKYTIRAHYVFVHTCLNIQLIFNPIKILESWELMLLRHTIKCCVRQSMLKMSKLKMVFNTFNMLRHTSLNFPKIHYRILSLGNNSIVKSYSLCLWPKLIQRWNFISKSNVIPKGRSLSILLFQSLVHLPTHPLPLHCVAPFSSPVVSESDKALSTLRSGHVPSFETFSFNWWSQCNILCQSFRIPAAVFVKLTTLSYPFRFMQGLFSTCTLFRSTQNEFRIFEYQDKAFKKSISIDLKESTTCRIKPEATLHTQELLKGPKIFTCNVKTLFGIMVYTRLWVLEEMLSFNPSLSSANVCLQVPGCEWLGCHTGHQEVSRGYTRGESQGKWNICLCQAQMAAHSGF